MNIRCIWKNISNRFHWGNSHKKEQSHCIVKKSSKIHVQVTLKVFQGDELLREETSHIEYTAENPVVTPPINIPTIEKNDLSAIDTAQTNAEAKTCETEASYEEILQKYTSPQANAHLKAVDTLPTSKEKSTPQYQTEKSYNDVDVNHAALYPLQEKDIKSTDNQKDYLVDNNTPAEDKVSASPLEVEEIPPSLLDIVNQNKKAEIEIFNTHLNDIVNRANSLLVELDIAKENLYLLERIKTVINDASSKIKSRGSEYDRQMLSEFSSENEPLLKFVKKMIEIRKENWAFANLSKDKECERANADLFDKFLKKLFADTPVKEISAEKNFDAARHNEVSSEDVCQGATIIETCQNGFEFDGIILDKAIVKTINTERD